MTYQIAYSYLLLIHIFGRPVVLLIAFANTGNTALSDVVIRVASLLVLLLVIERVQLVFCLARAVFREEAL